MKVAVTDVETSMKPVMHPWQEGAYLSVVGMGTDSGAYHEWWFEHDEVNNKANPRDIQEELDRVDLLVGHNIKFDMNWLKSLGLTYRGKFWDTMVVEYLLQGQRTFGLDLANVAETHGAPSKIDKVKTEYWDKGIDTAQIPQRILSNYLKGDCKATYGIYLSQKKQLDIQSHLSQVVNIHNNTINELSNIELNGMPVDARKIKAVGDSYKATLEGMDDKLRGLFRVKDLNFNSKFDLSAALYGGVIKRDGTEMVEKERWASRKVPYTFTYKDGRTTTKYRKERYREKYEMPRKCVIEKKIKGIGFIPIKGSELSTEGYYSTGKDTIKQLKAGTKVKKEIKSMLINRGKIQRLVSTLLGSDKSDGYIGKVQLDGKLHPQYNNTRTNTGRYSSKDPNGQNFSRAKEDQDGFLNPLKTIFIPSDTIDGCIASADLAQLEWRVAAFLSQDPVAMAEIINGIDAHLDNAVRFFGDAKFRQDAKIMTFRLLYGGTAYSFFMDPLMPDFSLKQWNKIVNDYYQKYHVLRDWQESNIQQVIQNDGWYISQFGRIFTFEQVEQYKYVKGQRVAYMGFKPTQIKNYEVQGTATGDIVPFAMYVLSQRMQKHPYWSKANIKWIGQIHDAILFDMLKKDLKAFADFVIQTFEDLPGLIEKYWGFKFNVPLTGDFEAGPNYGKMLVKYERKTIGGPTICKKKS